MNQISALSNPVEYDVNPTYSSGHRISVSVDERACRAVASVSSRGGLELGEQVGGTGWVWRGHALPRRSGGCGPERGGEVAEQRGVWTGGGEGDAHTACGLADTRGDFQEPEPDGVELGLGECVGFRDGVTQGEHEPIGGGVENEAHLVGAGVPAGR